MASPSVSAVIVEPVKPNTSAFFPGLTLAVVGSRTFPNEALAREVIKRNLTADNLFVSGGAKGPDTWGEERAGELGIPQEIIRPDPQSFSGNFALAALARNTDIVARADVILAFWDGQSRGTKDTIDKAMKAKKDLIVIRPNGDFIKMGFGCLLPS